MPAKQTRKLPRVALVGRANVGKSTLWNRMTESGLALVSDIAHTTRDRNYAPVLWRGAYFECVDTGGMDAEQGNEIGRGILRQAELAIKEADLVLFMIDSKIGALPEDKDLARRVRSLNKHVFLVANKADSSHDLSVAMNTAARSVGLNEAVPVSASTGRGVGDLLDRITIELTKLGKEPVPYEEPEMPLRLVVMGRPNVGKSSLVNSILGEDRVIVSPIAHTTREPMDTELEWKGEKIRLVDTAGMRKRSKVDGVLDEAALERNRQALMRADIAFLVVDAEEGPMDQDKHLAGLLKEENRGLVIVVNKWDLVENKDTRTSQAYEMKVRRALPFLSWAPVVFVSALKGQRTTELLDHAFRIREERKRQISYNALQRFLKMIVKIKRPMQESGPNSPYVHDIAQVGVNPPVFLITVRGQRGNLHDSWLRFFENRMREKFGFHGTPITVKAHVAPLIRSEMPDAIRNRPTRRKKPLGRRVGRY
jgi:GTP-binding protein